jgi:hypothetical protein
MSRSRSIYGDGAHNSGKCATGRAAFRQGQRPVFTFDACTMTCSNGRRDARSQKRRDRGLPGIRAVGPDRARRISTETNNLGTHRLGVLRATHPPRPQWSRQENGATRGRPHSLASRRCYLRATCTCFVALFPASSVAVTRIVWAPGATSLVFHWYLKELPLAVAFSAPSI